MTVQNVLKLSVRQVFQFLITDKHAIYIVVVERVVAMLQLVVMNDRDKRMQLRGTDIAGIVVDVVNSENLLHNIGKGTIKRVKKQMFFVFSSGNTFEHSSKTHIFNDTKAKNLLNP